MTDYNHPPPLTRIAPLCGSGWLRQHILDHTQEEIDALTLELIHDDMPYAFIPGTGKKGTVKNLVTLRR